MSLWCPRQGRQDFRLTQDYEVTFLIPSSKVETVLDGLAKLHKASLRYPITSFFNFEATFPPSYEEQMRIWKEEGEL